MANNRNTTQGTGFTDYNTLLNANQTSGQKSGEAIAGGLDTQKQNVLGDLNTQQNQFNQGLDTQKNQWSDISGQAKSLVDPASQGQWDATAQAASTLDPNQVGANFRGYNYSGPSGLQNANSLQTNAATASALGKLAGNSQGQQQLLRNYAGGTGNYTAGQSQFDQALLNKYGQASINQAAQGLKGIGSTVQSGIDTSTNLANQQKNLVTNQRNDITNQGTNAYNALDTQAVNQGNTFNNSAQNLQNVVNLAGQTLSSDPNTAISAKNQLAQMRASGIDVDNLIKNSGTMGLNLNDTLYSKNGKSAYNNSLISNLLGGIRENGQTINGKYYQGQQQNAAGALAQFLNNGNADAVKNNQFNTDVFGTNTNNPNLMNNISQLKQEAIDDQSVKAAMDAVNKARASYNSNDIQSGINLGNSIKGTALYTDPRFYNNVNNPQNSEYFTNGAESRIQDYRNFTPNSPQEALAEVLSRGSSPTLGQDWNTFNASDANLGKQQTFQTLINNLTGGSPANATDALGRPATRNL